MAESTTANDESTDFRKLFVARPDWTPNELVTQVARDQEMRWRRGERVLIESYLEFHPTLVDPAIQLDLIYAEVMLRESVGENPKFDEYGFRFPQLADSIHSLFQLHQALISERHKTPVIRLKNKPRPKSQSASNIELPGIEIEEEIGRGGMGIVYKAWQIELGRVVAVKMLRSDAMDPEWNIRLRREAESIAQIQNPNIVQVFEVGDYQDHPYLVLEYVAGGTLAERLRSGPLPPREAAHLLQTIAGAIQAAHDHQIIHRDLKPGNILLQSNEARNLPESGSPRGPVSPNSSSSIRTAPVVPKVTDFGLSKRLDQSALSHTGELIGTPNYMAPEQAGGGKVIGPAADVYALGAILYECLTGRPPFIGNSPVSILMQVTTDEPIAPTRLRPGVPRDLESVCLKCLEKSPNRRFSSAQDLADDLDRFLAGQPTVARPLSAIGKAVKFVRRYPAPFALSALLISSLIIGMIGVLWQWREAVHARHEEAEQRRAAELNLYFARLAQAESLWENGETGRARQLLMDCRPEPGQLDHRGWEWHYLSRLFHMEARIIPMRHWINGLSFQEDSTDETMKLIFAEGRPRFNMAQQPMPGDGRAGWITAPRNAPVSIHNGPDLPAGATAFAQLPEKKLLAWGTSHGWIVITHADGQTVSTVKLPSGVTSLAFHPDGKSLVAGAFDNERSDFSVIDVASGEVRARRLTGVGRPGIVCMGPNGEWFAVGGHFGRIRLFRPDDLAMIDEWVHLPDAVTALLVSRDGQTLFVGTSIGTVVAWNMTQRAESYRWSAHSGPVYAIATTRDGRILATGGSDNRVRLWQSRTGQPSTIFCGHESTVRCVAFSDDGRWLASGGQDAAIRIWDTTLDTRGRRILFHDRLNDIALVSSLSETMVRAVALNGRVQTFNLENGLSTSQFHQPIGSQAKYPVRYATFLGTHRDLVGIVKEDPKVLKRWNANDGQVLHTWPTASGSITCIATDANARFLAWATSADGNSDVYWWDDENHRVGGPVRINVAVIRAVAISNNGRYVAALANADNRHELQTAWVFDTTTNELPLQIDAGQYIAGAIAFRPDEQELTIAIDETVRAFTARTWAPKYRLPCARSTTCLAYSPDSRRLAFVGYSGNVTLADPSNGKRVFQLRGLAPGRPDDMACDARVAFSADGRWLVSTNWDGSINVWDGSPNDQQP